MAKLRIDLMSEEMELKLYENCSYNYKKGHFNYSGQQLRQCIMETERLYCNKCPWNYGLTDEEVNELNTALEVETTL